MSHEFEFVLGIDTSNYKTSAAIVSENGEILADERILLDVKAGERGLRQQDALFQHVNNLPVVIRRCFDKVQGRGKLAGVSVSDKPRPVEGSYMPVFNAGVSAAESIAAACSVQTFRFSHQEGHIEAGKKSCGIKDGEDFLSYHLSGGTMEFLKIISDKSGSFDVEIIGKTRDISYGQLLDRLGVLMGMRFPAGAEMDRIALDSVKSSRLLKPVFVNGLEINLSGLETQAMRALEHADSSERSEIVREVFDRISESLMKLTDEGTAETGISKVMFAGGVSSSRYLKNKLMNHYKTKDAEILFAASDLAQDNGAGIAILGGKKLWQSNL